MTFWASVTVILISAMAVQTGALSCPGPISKGILNDNKVTADVVSLLQGKTFVDVWRRKETGAKTDCTMTEFTFWEDKLSVRLLDVDKTGKTRHFSELWTEVKGEGQMNTRGNYDHGDGTLLFYFEHLYFFYADQYVYGYFTCGFGDGGMHLSNLRMAVSIVKDKKDDPTALESLAKAEAVMEKVKSLLPEEMVKLSQNQCPDTV